MIDESLLKSNFLGRDGFRWWIGQIPPISSQGEQSNGGGWGNRCKVRILGYHPYNTTELSNEDLPWAQILLPTTSGSGGANYAENPKIQPGDTVFGFFLDGDNGQIPVIIGCFGRTSQVPSNEFTSPFVPFTGYTNRIKNDGSKVKADQSNEQNSQSQKSPRDLSPSQIGKLNNTKEVKDEKPYFTGVGQEIVFSNSCDDTLVKGVGAEVNNLLQKVQNITSFASKVSLEIDRSAEKIQGISNGFVGQMFNSLFNKLIGLLQKGLELLYKTVFAKVYAATQNYAIAHLAGVAAQTAMVPPVKFLETSISTIANKIVDGLKGTIKDLLRSTIDNVDNFASCVGTQFTGAFLNSIISKIVSGLSGALNGVSKILSAAFSVADFLRSGISSIKSIGGLFDVNQSASKCSGNIKEWKIGYGGKSSDNENKIFKTVLNGMNIADKIGKIASFEKVNSEDSIISENTVSITSPILPVSKSDNIITLRNIEGVNVDGFISTNAEIMKIQKVNDNRVTVVRKYSGIATNYTINDIFTIIDKIPDSKMRKEVEKSSFEKTVGSWDIFKSSTKSINYISPFGGCYTGKPPVCGPPRVKIFGGGGYEATATAILGSFSSNNISENNLINEKTTSSIIGVRIDNPGFGYRYPPFVEFVDNCGQGYGAVARSVIDDTGKIIQIYMVSEGENYPVGNVTIESSVIVAEDNPPYVPYGVTEVVIENSGIGYEIGDYAIDNFDNTYNLTINENGNIIGANVTLTDNAITGAPQQQTITSQLIYPDRPDQPINTKVISDLPIINIISNTGSGAILKPIIRALSTIPQGEIATVRDCPD
jgi:hypothetical protein